MTILADLEPLTLALIFFIVLFVAFATGYHIAFAIGFSGLLLGILTLGPNATLTMIYHSGFKQILNYPLLCLPMFLFMGIMLGYSGVADALYEAFYVILGRLKGGLAMGTVILGALIAACLGVIAASVAMLTVVSLEPMLKRGYNKSLATGTICASGSLGILIPPSVLLVLYGPLANISVGKLFMGAFGPGFMLAGLYCIYIGIRCLLQPKIAPAAPAGEIQVPWTRKLTMLLSSLVPPVVLIFSVLGVIFLGIAPPTEAAAVGATASILLAVAKRKFKWAILKRVLLEASRTTGFIWLLMFFSVGSTAVFMRLGCGDAVGAFILAGPGGKWGMFAMVHLLIFILGMFMGWLPILFIIIPIITPLVEIMGFDPVWFALMICVNFQMAFMTPPMAIAIFSLKGALASRPELGVKTMDIIKGVYPFVAIVAVGMALCIKFPQIIMWLPNQMIQPW